MSISSLRRLNIKFCRQALFWTNFRFSVQPSSVVMRRSAHNNLYQMVKKRTLEARTKLQQPKFPNNQACITANKAASSKILDPALQSNEQDTGKLIPPKQTVCQNTQVLDATDCKRRSHQGGSCPPIQKDRDGGIAGGVGGAGVAGGAGGAGGAGAAGDAGAAGGGGPSGTFAASNGAEGGMDKNTKMLLALLAALGAGGLLLWLMSGGKDNNKQTSTDCKTGAVIPAGGVGVVKKIPASSADLPKQVPYLLIGGGTASFSAFRAIKSNDAKAKVLMIANEFRKPYMRPPLSKELWYSAQEGEVPKDYRFKQWTGAERSLYFEPDEFFVDPSKLMETVNGGIAVAQGYSVKKVDPANRIVTLTDGTEICYDECLIATGCSPKNLTVLANAPLSVKEKVMVYRTPEDFERLKKFVDEKKSVAIIGNGFIGSELACSLANYAKDKGIKIYQIFPETGNMSKLLPDYLSKWTTKRVEGLGVCVLPNVTIKEAKRDESNIQLKLSNGNTILTDVVVTCVGCEANTNIANNSGLEVDSNLGGFVVNAELEARRNLFVAGDASCFYDPLLGRRRVEHHDHSVVSGRLAGENMVGKKKAYSHQSMFWSDLGPEIGYEGIGLVDASLPTVGVFALPSKTDKRSDNLTDSETEVIENGGTLNTSKDMPDVNCDLKDTDNYGRGVIFYMKDDKIVGILLWNLFNRIGLARTIINQNKKFDDLNEVAKLFEIHS